MLTHRRGEHFSSTSPAADVTELVPAPRGAILPAAPLKPSATHVGPIEPAAQRKPGAAT